MSAKVFYFTGTGNSLYVAKEITKNIVGDVEYIRITEDKLNYKTDSKFICFVYPTYDFNAPSLVKRFVESVTIPKDAYVVLYATSGGKTGNSISTVKKILENKNIKISNAFNTVFPDNSVIIQKSKEENKKIIFNATKEVNINSIQIRNKKIVTNKKLEDNSLSDKILGKGMEIVVKKYYQFQNIKASDECTGCKICTKVCPTKNIEIKEKRAVCGNNCEMCLACIHVCPHKALSYKRMPKIDDFQYRHPEVQLKEMFT